MSLRTAILIAAAIAIMGAVFLTFNFLRPSSRADRQLAERDPDRAIAYWQSLLPGARTSVPYEKLALCFIAKKDYEEARKWALAGLTKFPGCVNLTFNLGFLEYHRKQYGESLRLLDEVLRTNGYYPNAHYLKGLAYEDLGDLPAARKEYVAEVNINPGSVRAWQKLKGTR